MTTAGKERARGNRSFHQLCSTSFHGCEVEFLLNKFLPGCSQEHLEESEQEETRTKNIIYIYLYIRMPIFKIFLIINMYLVAFFFLFSLNNQQNRHHHHHHHHHFHSSVKGTGRGGMRAGRSGTERGKGAGFRTECAQYKPQPRRLLAMMMSVTASNTTWMFPVSVAQVM